MVMVYHGARVYILIQDRATQWTVYVFKMFFGLWTTYSCHDDSWKYCWSSSPGPSLLLQNTLHCASNVMLSDVVTPEQNHVKHHAQSMQSPHPFSDVKMTFSREMKDEESSSWSFQFLTCKPHFTYFTQTNHLGCLLSSADVKFHFTSTLLWILHNVQRTYVEKLVNLIDGQFRKSTALHCLCFTWHDLC